MPRQSNFPTYYDECKSISIFDLKKWEYLKSGQWKKGAVYWSRAGEKTGDIGITVNVDCLYPHNSYIEFNYLFNKEPVNYKAQLVSIQSNIGKGLVWFFICPRTGKRCRKLHLVQKYFLHRSAFANCLYEKQSYSHKFRNLGKQCEQLFGVEKAYDQIYRKHFKKHYKGKPTKRYLKLLKQIEEGDGLSEEQLLMR